MTSPTTEHHIYVVAPKPYMSPSIAWHRLILGLPQAFAADEKEHVMDRINEQRDEDLIDLGAASAETKGPPGVLNDSQGQLIGAGISDD